MNIKPFAVEEWMNAWEAGATYNVAETCVDSISLNQLLELTGEDRAAFFGEMGGRKLTYGDITGAPVFKEGICGLYRTIRPEHIVPTHGAAGANHHVFLSLLKPGDHVVSVMPTYQQLYSIPACLGAEVDILPLRKENAYLPDLNELKRLVKRETRMICINNPNNPTGALMGTEMLKAIFEIADRAGAWVLCDEVYRHLTQTEEWCESGADLYDKGISVSSMSKVFSLAGLRLGWIACRNQEAIRSFLSHRDYNLISCGGLDEMAAALALKHRDRLLARNRGIIRENLEILDQWVQKEPHISYVKPQAGTTALIHYDLPVPSYQFCENMYRESGVFVTPGDCFEEPGCFRLGYACDKQTLTDGLQAIHEFVEKISGGDI